MSRLQHNVGRLTFHMQMQQFVKNPASWIVRPQLRCRSVLEHRIVCARSSHNGPKKAPHREP